MTGATQAASNGPFTFSGGTGTYTAASGAFSAAYKGRVTMRGHETPVGSSKYDLAMTLANPKITVTGSTGVMTLDALDSDGKSLPGLKFVNLVLTGKTPTVSGPAVTYTGVPTTMHNDAVALFGMDGGSFYTKNEPFDLVTFSLTTSAATPSATSTSTAKPCVTTRATSSASPSRSSSPTGTATPTATTTTSPVPGTGRLPATGGNPAPLMLLASGFLAGGTVLLSFSFPVKGGRYRRRTSGKPQ